VAIANLPETGLIAVPLVGALRAWQVAFLVVYRPEASTSVAHTPRSASPSRTASDVRTIWMPASTSGRRMRNRSSRGISQPTASEWDREMVTRRVEVAAPISNAARFMLR
jgi:hypothetical protein